MKTQRLQSAKRIGTGLAFVVFPFVFIFAFAIHPNLLIKGSNGESRTTLR